MSFEDEVGASKFMVLARTHSYIKNGYRQHLRAFIEVLLEKHDVEVCRDLCKKDCGCKCHRRPGD